MKKRNILISYLFLMCVVVIGLKINLNAQENIEISKETEAEIQNNRAAGIFDLPDDVLEQELMDYAKYSGALGTMPEDELLNIGVIEIGDDVTSLEGMDYYIEKGLLDNTYYFQVESVNISDYSPIMNWNSLTELYLVGSHLVTNLDCFANTTFDNLEDFYIIDTGITDISGLATTSMPNIVNLDFRENQIESLEGLESLNPKRIYAQNNQIESISSIDKMTNLNYLNLDKNKLTNLDGLENPSVARFSAKVNQINDISGIVDSKNLKNVVLDENEIEDISPLAELPILESINLNDNKIYDLSPLKNLGTSVSTFYIEANNQNITIDLGKFDDINNVPVEVKVILKDGTEVKVPYGLDVNDIVDYDDYSYTVSFNEDISRVYFNGNITVNFSYVQPIPLTPLDPSIPTTVDTVVPSKPTVSNKETQKTEGKKLIQTGTNKLVIILSILLVGLISLRLIILNKNFKK